MLAGYPGVRGARLLCAFLSCVIVTDAFMGSASVGTKSSIAMSNDNGFFDKIPSLDSIPKLSMPSTPFSKEEETPETFSPDTFEPLPENLIARAKTVVATDLGIQDPALLSEDFLWIGPLLEKPLDKVDYLAAGRFFNVRGAFPDLDYRAHDFRVDANDPMTVRCTVRPTGSMRGSLRLRNEIVEPNGKPLRGPPEGVSMTFDSKGSLVKLCSGFALDRCVGNTNGLCGVMAAATIAGVPPSDWEVYPVPAVISRFFGRPLEPLPEVSTFLAPFPETVMIQLVKGIVSANLGADDPSLLASDFNYLTPLVGPIGKGKFLEEYAAQEFGGFEPECSHFRVDPYDPYRVWVDIKLSGPGLDGPPQAFSFAFDDDGFCTRITGAAVLDPSVGGLAGSEGIRYALGEGSLDLATRPLPLAIGRLKKTILSPITNIDPDDYLLKGQSTPKPDPVQTPKPPAARPPPDDSANQIRAEATERARKAEIPQASKTPRKPAPPKTPPKQAAKPPAKKKAATKKKASPKKKAATKKKAAPKTLFFSTPVAPKQAPKKATKKAVKGAPSASQTAAKAAAEKKREAAIAAAEKAKANAARVAAEKKKRDAEEAARAAEQKRIAVEAEKQRAAEMEQQKKLATQQKMSAAEDQKKAAQAAAAKKSAEDAKAAAEKKKQELEAKKAAQAAAAKQLAEENRAAAEKRKQELEERKAAKAAEAKQLAEQRKAAAEQKRQEAEAKRLAAAEERRRKAEEIKAALAQKQKEAEAKREAAAEKRRALAQSRQKAPVKGTAPKKQEASIPEFSFPQFNFGAPQKKQAPKPVAKPPTPKTLKAPKSSPMPTFSFGSPKPKTPKAAAKAPKKGPVLATAPKGVPTIVKWSQRPNGAIAGLIFGAINFKEGERVETSPITSGSVQNGGVVTSGSGSRYFLSDKTVQQMRRESSGKVEEAPAASAPRATLQLAQLARERDLQAKRSREAATKAAREAAAKAALASTEKAKPRATFSLTALFASIGKQLEAPPKIPSSKVSRSPVTRKGPKGVPAIGRWKQNRDKSITGFISGSAAFADGEKITTSPIGKGTVAPGQVVVTSSGTRYFLQ